MTDWVRLQSEGRYAQVASLLIEECETVDINALAADAYDVISASTEVAVVLQDRLDSACGGGGYYRADPPTIYLHPSILRRDNFTLLHELGHHLQQFHPEWSYVLMDLAPDAALLAEEEVANAVAVQVLMPWVDDALDARDVHPADVMAGLFATTAASRSAVVQRVAGLLPDSAKWILAVADLDGTVQSAATTYADAQPAKGSEQPGFAALASQAMRGPVRRRFSEGLRYSTGSELHDMRAEAVLDADGRYVFVALTPESRFGTGKLIRPSFDCANPSCGRSFEARNVEHCCSKCGHPACTWCSRCGCDPTDTGKTCLNCNMRLTPVELANRSHECW